MPKLSSTLKRPSSPRRVSVPRPGGFTKLAEAQKVLSELHAQMDERDMDLKEKAQRIEASVTRAMKAVEDTLEICRQTMLAGVLADSWLPASFYEDLFVSRATLGKWTREGLPRRYVCQRLCVRPRDFFARVDAEASNQPPASAGNLKPKYS